MWTTPPTTLLSPTAATALPESTPHLCRKRTLSAMPPTFAGDTRLTKEDATWVRGGHRAPADVAPIR